LEVFQDDVEEVQHSQARGGLEGVLLDLFEVGDDDLAEVVLLGFLEAEGEFKQAFPDSFKEFDSFFFFD
jgi:hypothetical protein